MIKLLIKAFDFGFSGFGPALGSVGLFMLVAFICMCISAENGFNIIIRLCIFVVRLVISFVIIITIVMISAVL